MSNVLQGDCSYCDQKDTSVRPTPFLADIALGARMCWRCWGLSETASGGQIGRFWQTEQVFRIEHEKTPFDEGLSPMQGIVENVLKTMPEEMLYAMLAGCKIESDYDAEKGILKFKTANPIKVVKSEGKVLVYELSK